MTTNIDTTKNYEDLANAIILEAVKDYKSTLRILEKKPGSRIAQNQIDRIEKFFRSDWFAVLTRLDPEALMWILRKKDTNKRYYIKRDKIV